MEQKYELYYCVPNSVREDHPSDNNALLPLSAVS